MACSAEAGEAPYATVPRLWLHIYRSPHAVNAPESATTGKERYSCGQSESELFPEGAGAR